MMPSFVFRWSFVCVVLAVVAQAVAPLDGPLRSIDKSHIFGVLRRESDPPSEKVPSGAEAASSASFKIGKDIDNIELKLDKMSDSLDDFEEGGQHESTHGANSDDSHHMATDSGHGHEGNVSASHNYASSHGPTTGHDGARIDVRADPWVLFHIVLLVVVVLEFLNSKDVDIKRISCSTVSNNMSLVCAIVVWRIVREVIIDLSSFATLETSDGTLLQRYAFSTTSNLDNPHGISTFGDVVALMGQLIFFAMVLQGVLCLYKDFEFESVAICTMGSHVVAFSGLEAFGTWQLLGFWSESGARVILFDFVCLVTLLFCVWASSALRRWIIQSDGTETEEEKDWDELCSESEDDVFGFAFGMIIAQTFRYFIEGEMKGYHGIQENHNMTHQLRLLACVAMLGVIIVFADQLQALLGTFRLIPLVRRTFECFITTCGMTMGWSLVFLCQYIFFAAIEGSETWGKDPLAKCIAMSAYVYIISYAAIATLDMISDSYDRIARAVFSFQKALMLFMTMISEFVLMKGIDELITPEADESDKTVIRLETCALLFVCIAPCWYFHILPRTIILNCIKEGEDMKEELAEADKAKPTRRRSRAGSILGSKARKSL